MILRHLDRALDRLGMAGEDDLAGIVVVGDFADLSLCSRFGQRGRLVDIGPEQRGHRAFADRHRILHGDAAQAQKLRRVRQRESARRAQGGVFTERMARDAGGVVRQLDPEFLRQHALGGDGVGHDRGLRIRGQRQFAFRPFAHQSADFLRQRLVDFLEHFARNGAGIGEIGTHPDLLAPLTGEDKGFHRVSPL